MKKNRALKMFAVLSTSALLLTACNSDKEPANNKGKEEPKEAVKQVLTWPGAAELPSLDSSKSTDAESFVVLGNTIEGLYTLDSKEEATPAMAEKFETSADGKVITFHLRKDAKWSNGDPVTAKDFEYAWKRLLDPATKSEYAYIAYDVKNAAEVNAGKKKVDELGVKAVNDHTFEVTLNTAVPYFVKLTTFPSFFPLNEKFVKEKGEKYALEAENLLSNGPFMMTEWKHEQSYQLKKNPTYWDAKNVKLEEINFKIVKDASTSTNLYEAGQLDRAGLSAEFIDKYKDHKDKKINPDASIFFLRLNQKNPALANVNIRKAIDLAYDKEGISTVILNNGSTVANYLVPKGFVKDPSGVDFRDANKDLVAGTKDDAKKYWEQGLKEIGKDKVTLELLNTDSEVAKKIGEYIKEQLQNNLPGLTVNIKQQPFKQKLDLETKLDYDFSMGGWGPDYPDPMTFLDMFVTDGGHNQMAYSNPEFDKLISDAKTTLVPDQQKRWEALLQAEKILIEKDQAISPIYQRGATYLQKPYVKNVVDYSFGPDWLFKSVYIEK